MKLDRTDAKKEGQLQWLYQYNFWFLYCTYTKLKFFAWAHECFTEVKSSSSTNLCIIPHKALTVHQNHVFLSFLCML